jgi:hypothetical protein
MQGTSLMNVFHASMEEVVTSGNELNSKKDQLNLARIFIDIESNSRELVITQPTFACIFNHDQLDIANQQNLVEMLVEYQALGPTNEIVTSLTEPCDVKHGSFYELKLYQEEAKVEYSLKHKDSMEVQMVELIHVLAKKTKDVKRSYGKKVRQLSLEVECLHGIIMYEQDHAEQHIDPQDFEAHWQEWERNNVRFVVVKR